MPVSYFFENAAGQGEGNSKRRQPDYTAQFLSTKDGLALAQAFMTVEDMATRRALGGEPCGGRSTRDRIERAPAGW